MRESYKRFVKTHSHNSQGVLLDVQGLENVCQLSRVSLQRVHALRQEVGQLVEVALAGQGSNVQHKLFHRRICEEQKNQIC